MYYQLTMLAENRKCLLFHPPDKKLSTEGIQVKLIDFILALARYLNRDVQTVSSWTGFNIFRRRNNKYKKTLGCLSTTDEPATQTNTIFEILHNADSIKNALNLKPMVIVMDQAIMQRRSILVGSIRNCFKI